MMLRAFLPGRFIFILSQPIGVINRLDVDVIWTMTVPSILSVTESYCSVEQSLVHSLASCRWLYVKHIGLLAGTETLAYQIL